MKRHFIIILLLTAIFLLLKIKLSQMKFKIGNIILNGIIIAVILFFYSCAPAYIPNVINSPMFNNGGELQVSTYASTSGLDAQAAFAISDNVGIMANGSFMDRTDEFNNDYHKHKFIEFGGGYYDQIERRGRYEIFAGFGAGELQAKYDNSIWSSYTDVKSYRYFLQPAIGVTGNVADFSTAMRVVLIDLYQGSRREKAYFFEPAITGKLGYKHVKAIMQFGLSIPTNPDAVDFNYQPVIMSLGLQLNIGRVYDE